MEAEGAIDMGNSIGDLIGKSGRGWGKGRRQISLVLQNNVVDSLIGDSIAYIAFP
ncbi:hypothetical protein RDI58_022359 [Solanum bulbocastanum]|uniref:Uncharacterized protein n=1 Tax=Solanum bulbocastanum TaxID=147425 RepID=A0AAN8Y555_SOLBU